MIFMENRKNSEIDYEGILVSSQIKPNNQMNMNRGLEEHLKTPEQLIVLTDDLIHV